MMMSPSHVLLWSHNQFQIHSLTSQLRIKCNRVTSCFITLSLCVLRSCPAITFLINCFWRVSTPARRDFLATVNFHNEMTRAWHLGQWVTRVRELWTFANLRWDLNHEIMNTLNNKYIKNKHLIKPKSYIKVPETLLVLYAPLKWRILLSATHFLIRRGHGGATVKRVSSSSRIC